MNNKDQAVDSVNPLDRPLTQSDLRKISLNATFVMSYLISYVFAENQKYLYPPAL